MANPNNPNATPATTLKGRDLQIFSLHMLGKSNIEISQILQIHVNTVCFTMKAPYFLAAKQEVFKNTMDQIVANTAGAFSPLTMAKAAAGRMMANNIAIAENSKNEQTRLRAIHDILDRVMGKPTQRIAVEDLEDSILEKMSDEELDGYVKRGEIPQWASDAGLGHGKSGNNPSTVH